MDLLLKNKQVDDETEENIYKVLFISEKYFSIDQVHTFISLNSDINTPEISTALKNTVNYVKKSYCSGYSQKYYN